MFNVVAFTQRLGWWRCWLWPSMLGSLPRWSSCRTGKLTLGTTRTRFKIYLLTHTHSVSSRLKVSGVYFPLPGRPSCAGSVSRATQRGVSTGRLLRYAHPKATATNTQMDSHVFFVCVFVTPAISSPSVVPVKDLDAALPLIHTHKEQLVAIGEVTPQCAKQFCHPALICSDVLSDEGHFCFLLSFRLVWILRPDTSKVMWTRRIKGRSSFSRLSSPRNSTSLCESS